MGLGGSLRKKSDAFIVEVRRTGRLDTLLRHRGALDEGKGCHFGRDLEGPCATYQLVALGSRSCIFPGQSVLKVL